MAVINLTQGKVAVVDDEDFDWLSQWKWRAQYSRDIRGFYAVRAQRTRIDGAVKDRCVVMHRLILGLDHGNRLVGDHINHNTLDNRRSNLRAVTQSQNRQNSLPYARAVPGLKGAFLDKRANRWFSEITCGGVKRHLGMFSTAESAHAAYCEAAHKYHGEFACTGSR